LGTRELRRRPKAKTQAERRDEAERRILEVATDIIAEDGLEALTLAGAGERAGYSRGLPAHYFRNKDELISALVTYITGSFAEPRNNDMVMHVGIDSLATTINRYLEGPLRHPARVRAFHAILASALHTPLITATVAEMTRQSTSAIASAIHAGIEVKAFRADIDPEIEAVLILAGLRGAVAQWLINPKGFDLRHVSDVLVKSMKRRLLA
jgi:AcrR family transcriptional regulator